MNNLVQYKLLPEWDINTLPEGFRQQHNTKVGTWAKLKIFSGELKFYQLSEAGEVLATTVFDKDSDIPFIEPQAWHKVEPLTDDLRCQLAFYCQPQDFYQKKYQLSATHSEVLAVTQHIQSGDALDLGCGRGRNSLYLQGLGFNVTAIDQHAPSIEQLNEIIRAENLAHIKTSVGDIVSSDLGKDKYDLIVSTVVLMFLDPPSIPVVIDKMQNATRSGGYNLIVSAMDSDDYPLNGLMPFGFSAGELKNYYRDWDMVKYNEDVGHLHRVDENGNRIALRFATLIAKKR